MHINLDLLQRNKKIQASDARSPSTGTLPRSHTRAHTTSRTVGAQQTPCRRAQPPTTASFESGAPTALPSLPHICVVATPQHCHVTCPWRIPAHLTPVPVACGLYQSPARGIISSFCCPANAAQCSLSLGGPNCRLVSLHRPGCDLCAPCARPSLSRGVGGHAFQSSSKRYHTISNSRSCFASAPLTAARVSGSNDARYSSTLRLHRLL